MNATFKATLALWLTTSAGPVPQHTRIPTVAVRIEGHCAADWIGENHPQGPLAWISESGQTITVDCSAIARTIAPVIAHEPDEVRRRLFARAVAFVLAHELRRLRGDEQREEFTDGRTCDYDSTSQPCR